MSLDTFIDTALTYRCRGCDNFYCDPWFSPEVSARLFASLGADHLFAWGNFENWLHRLPPKQSSEERLFEALVKRIGEIGVYGEYGCPFQGFLQLFRGFEAAPRKRLQLFARSLDRPRDPRWSRITSLHNSLQRSIARLTVLNLRLRGWAVRSKNALGGQPVVRPAAPKLPAQRYLLTRDSSVGWGSNCVRFGASCRYFAQAVLGAEIVPFEEAGRRGPAAYHLIGIFNSLDHTTYPLEVVKRAVALAQHVLIVTHHAHRAGKQHWFAFGDDFGKWLERSIEGVRAIDLGAEIANPHNKENNYILLSRLDGAQ